MIQQHPMEPPEYNQEDCVHEWVLVNDERGEGAWHQTFDYYQCDKCGEQRDVPNMDMDITNPSE